MILELLRWWYGTGWFQTAHHSITWAESTGRTFSVPLLIRTLFAPWRRIVNVGGRSLDEKARAILDNLISRCVGFVVRLFVLIAAGLITGATLLSAFLLTLIWPVLPIMVFYFLARSITG